MVHAKARGLIDDERLREMGVEAEEKRVSIMR